MNILSYPHLPMHVAMRLIMYIKKSGSKNSIFRRATDTGLAGEQFNFLKGLLSVSTVYIDLSVQKPEFWML